MAVSTKTRDADRKSQDRAKERDLFIPEVFDPIRRKACEADDEEWLRTYCSDVFYNPFTPHQQRIIEDCREALLYGTQKCKAAPRGDGKSSIVKYLALKYTLNRQLLFPLIVAATSSKAKKTLSSLKRRLSKREVTALSQDYPLECTVAQYVDPWPSRGRNVTANGQRTVHVEWGADSIILPTWEDEEPLGPIILSLGITSDDIQGCNIYDRRPDFVMLDDLDSRDSLASEDGVVAGKIEETVDKSIAGLGGQSRRLGKFMLCTITSRDAAAYRYSDPKIKPSWAGERIAAIIQWPEKKELWQEYIDLRVDGTQTTDGDGQPVDPFGRAAHAYYLANREAMDAGAVLANPYNFESALLPDGSQKQVSALQRCYDYIADQGMESFQTEHQNDPPDKAGSIGSGITPTLIQRRLSGFARRVVPPDCLLLSRGIDARKTELHYVIKAWRKDGTNFVVNYDTFKTHGTVYKSDEGLESAIYNAVLGLFEDYEVNPCIREDGEIVPVDITLIDSGWQAPAIYDACRTIGMGIYPSKGHGKSNGCVSLSFSDASSRSLDRKPGDGWFLKKHREPLKADIWVAHCDTDRWKVFDHARWLTPADKPGAAFIFGEMTGEELANIDRKTPKEGRLHLEYAEHICSVTEVEEFVKDKLVRYLKTAAKKQSDHYLDASYLADVGAWMKGIRLVNETTKAAPVLDLAAMQKARK